MNRVQFQPGLSLPDFLHTYGTEAACEDEAVVVSPLRRAGCLSTGPGRRISSARGEFRVALLSEGGIRFAILPYVGCVIVRVGTLRFAHPGSIIRILVA
jgi:hypothetical protein